MGCVGRDELARGSSRRIARGRGRGAMDRKGRSDRDRADHGGRGGKRRSSSRPAPTPSSSPRISCSTAPMRCSASRRSRPRRSRARPSSRLASSSRRARAGRRPGGRADDREPARAGGSGERLGLVCLTLGAEGAGSSRTGRRSHARSRRPWRRSTARARATRSPPVRRLAARRRTREESLHRACAAGALAASRFAPRPRSRPRRRWTRCCERGSTELTKERRRRLGRAGRK